MVVGVDAGLAANRRSTLKKKEHQRLLKSRSARTFGGFSLPAQWPAYAERSAARQNTSNSVITVSWVINQWTVALSVRRSRGTSLLWSGGQRKPGMAKPGVREDGGREL